MRPPALLFAVLSLASCPLTKPAVTPVPVSPPIVVPVTPPAAHLETIHTLPGADGILVMDLQGGPYFAVADALGATGYQPSHTRLVVCPTDCRQADVPLTLIPPPPVVVVVVPPVVIPPTYVPHGSGLSAADPVIAMSADPAICAINVRASLAFFGRTDDSYWRGACGPASNGWSDLVWRQGWNKYWEDRADPTNQGSANPKDGNLPAVHQ